MAIPGILQQLAGSNPTLGRIKGFMNAVKMSQNPQAMLNQMMMSNPQLKQVMDIVSRYGGDSDRAFLETAKQMGVDPQEIYNLMS